MKIKLLTCAEQEFLEAIDYYNNQCPGLGYEFAAEVTNTLERISTFPKAGQKFPLVPGVVSLTSFPLALFIKFVTTPFS